MLTFVSAFDCTVNILYHVISYHCCLIVLILDCEQNTLITGCKSYLLLVRRTTGPMAALTLLSLLSLYNPQTLNPNLSNRRMFGPVNRRCLVGVTGERDEGVQREPQG